MKKTLYSLILSDDVVHAVDILAHQTGMSRSALVNRILAEYVSVQTPENRINDIFRAMEAMIAPRPELVPFFSPNSTTMSLKSSLAYKYRPTVKYEVALHGGTDGSIGELAVIFRTQSAPLIRAMTAFFRLWAEIERILLVPQLGAEIECLLYDGKFVRPLAAPVGRDGTAEELAQALSDYIHLFDRTLKGYLSGELSALDVERLYARDLEKRTVIL
ncbi:MAG: hypothetical protein IJP30_01400 [Clostridia bacterium]|nr:hypothetical protein [Clostridia bacterium]